jgi:sec-independent protein translocase protein TatC
MKRYSRHSIVIILILAAFLTPGADPVSQVVLAVPLALLYEISIFISKLSQKKKLNRKNLSEISKPIKSELEKFNELFKSSLEIQSQSC